MNRRLGAGFLALVALAGGLASGGEVAAQDTAAVAVNTHDGSSLFRLAFQIRRTTDSVLDAQNVAIGYSTCSECQTVAASFQVVLAFTDPEVATPTNLAIAVNEGCEACTTVVHATQVVLGTDGPARFTDEGNRRLAELRRRLQSIRVEELTAEQLLAELKAISAELKEVVATELVPAGDPATTGTAATNGTATTTTSRDGATSTTTTGVTTTTAGAGGTTTTTGVTTTGVTTTTVPTTTTAPTTTTSATTTP